MKAFVKTAEAGAEGLELDVQMTKDGELVVIHDEKIDRTTNGKGYVKDYTAKEIRKFDAGQKEPIPFLKDVFTWLSGNSMICNIEFKNGLFPYKGMEDKVISLVREYQLEKRIILSSFNHYSVVYANQFAPEIETAPILAEGLYMPWIYAQSIRSKGFHPNFKAAPNEIIKQSLEHNIAIRPYTVNNESEMERLMKAGCSAIITDDPIKAFKVREGIKKRS